MGRTQSYASALADALLKDNIITYSVSQVPPHRGWVDFTMNQLEEDLGIDFVRVESDAEIDVRYTDVLTGYENVPEMLGFASTRPNYTTSIEVKNGEYFRSVMVHEVGHALGLDHFHEDFNSAMSYNHDPSKIDYFSDQDIFALQSIFDTNLV